MKISRGAHGVKEGEGPLTLRTRAMVLDSLSSKYPNNSASDSLPWLIVEFRLVLQSDKALTGSLLLAYCSGTSCSTDTSSRRRSSVWGDTVDTCNACEW